MKRKITKLVSAALAATLLTATAANAAPSYRYSRPAPRAQYHNSDNGAALGFGLFALGLLAVVASQNNHRDDHDRYYAPPPPPRDRDDYYAPQSNHYYPTNPRNGNDRDRDDGYGYGR